MVENQGHTEKRTQFYVFDPYRGRPSNEQYIPIGYYLEDDPVLMVNGKSIGQLLVDKGHAVAQVVDVFIEDEEVSDEPVLRASTAHLKKSAETQGAPRVARDTAGVPLTPTPLEASIQTDPDIDPDIKAAAAVVGQDNEPEPEQRTAVRDFSTAHDDEVKNDDPESFNPGQGAIMGSEESDAPATPKSKQGNPPTPKTKK